MVLSVWLTIEEFKHFEKMKVDNDKVIHLH
jgi:hypothetical protein